MINNDGKLSFEIGLDTEKLRQDARDAKNILGGISSKAAEEGAKIDNAFRKIATATAGIFTIGAAKSFIQQITKARSEVESLEVSFRTLLGSESTAMQLMNEIKDYAVMTPMQVSDLASAAQTMLAFNISAEKVMPTLKAIGDISMGDAQKFQSLTLSFSQMSATGKLMGQDLLQMINAGFNPLSIIAEKTGKSIGELKDEMSKGAISADMVAQAFMDATSEGGKFYGMLEQQSKTLNGAMSNLQGAISDMLAEIGKSLEGPIRSAIDTTTNLVKNYEKVGKVLLSLIEVYGAYKASTMAVIATEKAVELYKRKEAAARLLNIKAITAENAIMKTLNKTMLTNPYVLLATGIAAVGASLWNANESARKLKKSISETTEQISKEQAHATLLIGKIENLDSSTDEYKETLDELLATYPGIIEKYVDEEGHLTNIASARQDIIDKIRTEIAEKARLAKMEDVAVEFDQERAKALEKLKKSLEGLPNAEAIYEEFAKEWNRKGYSSQINESVWTTRLKERTGLNVDKVSRYGVRQVNKIKAAVATMVDAVNNAYSQSKKINDLYIGIGANLSGENATDNSTSTSDTKELTEEEKKKAEERAKLMMKLKADRLAAEREYRKAVAQEVRKTEQEILEARITEGKTGLEAELAQNEINYARMKSAIEDRAERMVDDFRKAEESKWKEKNPNGTEEQMQKYLEQFTVKDLPEQLQRQLEELYKIAAKQYETANRQSLENSIQDVMTYAQRREKIEKDSAQKIADLTKQDGSLREGVTEGNIEEVKRQKEEALRAVDEEFAKRDQEFLAWSNQVAKMSLVQLEKMLLEAQTALTEAEAESGVDDESMAVLRAKVNELMKAINSMRLEPKATDIDKWREWDELLTKSVSDINDIGDAVGGVTGEVVSELSKAATSTIGFVTNIVDLANWSVKAEKMAAEGASVAIQTAEKASVILAVISTAVQIVSQINNAINTISNSAKENAVKQYKDDVYRLEREYENLDRAIERAFGDDKVSLMQDQQKNLRKQIEDLKAAQEEAVSEKGLSESEREDVRREYDEQITYLERRAEELGEATTEAIFGTDIHSAIDSLGDAIVDAWSRGEDAAGSFRNQVNAMVRNIVSTYVKQMIAGEEMVERITSQIKSAMSDEIITNEELNAIYDFADGLADEITQKYGWIEDLMNRIGRDENGRSSASSGIAQASQDSIDELNGRMTAVQGHTFSIAENTRILTANTSAILNSVKSIENDVAAMRRSIQGVEADVATLRRNGSEIITNGINIR